MEFTKDDIGYWVSGSSNNTADEIAAQTIDLARERGMAFDTGILEVIAQLDGWCEDGDDSQWLSDVGWDAVMFLSSLCPDGFYFEWDDGLVMRSDDEDEDN